jgi:hypothetical protein
MLVNGYFTTKDGMTKREYFAASVLPGLASRTDVWHDTPESDRKVAQTALRMADALLAELGK